MKSVKEQGKLIIENYRKNSDYPKMEIHDSLDGYIWIDFGIIEMDFDCSLDELETEINQKLTTIDGLEFEIIGGCGPSFEMDYKMLVDEKSDDISHNEKLLGDAINAVIDILKNRKALL